MIAVTSRQKFMKSFMDEQNRVRNITMTEDEAYAELLEMGKCAQGIADRLLMTCKKYGFDKLP